MKMADPQPQFAHLISQLRDQLPSFAYIHMVESRIARTEDIEGGESTEWARELWGKDRVFFSAGGYKLDSAKQVSEQWPNLAVIFGRHFIANVSHLPSSCERGFGLLRCQTADGHAFP